MKNSKVKIVMCMTVVAMFVSALSTQAQTVDGRKRAEFGLRFMPTFSSFDIKTSTGGTVSGQVRLGYGIGAFVAYNVTDNMGIQGEIIYSYISQKYSDKNVDRKINLKYFNIPLLLSLNTGKSKMVNFNLSVGPQLGINVGSSLETTTNNSDVAVEAQPVLSLHKADLGFAYGGGLDFGLNESRTCRLGVGFRGVYGLFDVSNNNKTSTTNTYYILDRTHIKTNSLYAGLSFLF